MMSSYTVNCITPPLNNKQPAFLKMFQSFGFFLDVKLNHHHSIQSWLVKYCGNNEQKLQLLNVGGNVLICFHPPISVFLLDLEALYEQFHLGNLNLPCFSNKTKKNLRAKTLKFKSNEPWNTETHKMDQNPPITNHMTFITHWSKLLFPKRSVKICLNEENCPNQAEKKLNLLQQWISTEQT